MADDMNGAAATWVVVKDPLNGKNVAIVGMYGDDGVIGIIPVYDFRDFNQDGKVSLPEWLVSHAPIIGEQAVETAIGSLLRTVAMDDQVLDSNLFATGNQVMVRAAFVSVREAVKSLYLDKLGEAAGETLSVARGLSGVPGFLVKKGYQQTFKKMIRHVVR